MKQLQKDTTTPEQSQRLLELGVPKWTANYKHGYVGCCSGESVLDMDNVISCNELCDGEIPLWSVGRLIEIDNICSIQKIKDAGFHLLNKDFDNLVESIIIGLKMKEEHCWLDFSKLED